MSGRLNLYEIALLQFHRGADAIGLDPAFGVLGEMGRRGLDSRTAAMALALGRLERVYFERGIFP
jgi:hypothetical protein